MDLLFFFFNSSVENIIQKHIGEIKSLYYNKHSLRTNLTFKKEFI